MIVDVLRTTASSTGVACLFQRFQVMALSNWTGPFAMIYSHFIMCVASFSAVIVAPLVHSRKVWSNIPGGASSCSWMLSLFACLDMVVVLQWTTWNALSLESES